MPLFLIFLLGSLICVTSWVVDDEYRKTRVGLLVIGVCMVSVALALGPSRTPFNDSQRTVDVRRGDTLYVVPKDGINGLAITAGNDSTGLVLVVKKFTAQHTIKPRVEQ